MRLDEQESTDTFGEQDEALGISLLLQWRSVRDVS